MRTVLLFFIAVNLCFNSRAQDKVLLAGLVRDMTTNTGLPSVHVVNLTDTMATITDLQGIFRIPVKAGDSLLVSSIGYSDKTIRLTDSILNQRPLYISLAPKIYELGEVTVNPLGSKAQFRKDFMNLDLANDELEIAGLPKKEVRSFPVWEDADEIKKAKYLLSPASYLYYNFNRHAKARQEYRRLTELDGKRDEARKKVDTVAIGKFTGLEGDSLYLFINSCGVTDAFLMQATAYEVMLFYQQKFAEFSSTATRRKD